MTDENQTGTDAEGVDWGDMSPAAASAAGYDEEVLRPAPATYPEFPENPANHRFTISIVADKSPMIVVRANTAAECTAAFNELEAYGAYANIGAAVASLRAQGALGNGLGPVTPVTPQGPPPGLPQAPPAPVPQGITPPPFGPNVSVPQAPGFMGNPGFPPAQQQGGWGGQQGGRAEPKPRPAGWLMVDVPFGDKERFKAMRENAKDYVRGKVQWGGKGVYWLEPSIAGWIAQQGFPVTQ